MKNKQILKKVIERAVKNGYQWHTLHWSQNRLKEGVIEHIIFSHDFAKHFWGEGLHSEQNYEQVIIREEIPSIDENYEIVGVVKEDKIEMRGYLSIIPYWQYHLQQMVLEEEPLKYIEKYL